MQQSPEVEEQLAREFGTLQISAQLVEQIHTEVESARIQTQAMDRELRTNIRAKLRQLDIKEERLLDLAADASINSVRLRERLSAIQLERGNLTDKLALTDLYLQRGAQVLDTYLEMLSKPTELFAVARDKTRRQLLQTFSTQLFLDFDAPARREVRDIVQEVRDVATQLNEITAPETVHKTKSRRTLSSAASNAQGLLAQFFFPGFE